MSTSKKIAIIDICGTLYHSNTTFDFLDFYLNFKKYARFRKLSRNIAVKLINKILFYFFHFDIIRWKAVRFLKGIKHETLIEEVRKFYDTVLYAKVNSEVMEKIRVMAQEKQLILVSATLDFIALVISEKTSILTSFSSELAYDRDKVCMGKIRKDLLGNKLRLLKEHSLEQKYDTVVTDNYSDRYLFHEGTINYIVTNKKKQHKWSQFLKRHNLQATFIQV